MSRHRGTGRPAAQSHARAVRPAGRGLGGGAGSGERLERTLRLALFCALGLLLLTPLVVTPSTVAPYTCGKALWARSLIEIAFALWAVLAVLRPGYRAPPSWMLLLMAAGLGVAVLAALSGASPQRSFWSTTNRMGGVVDQAHWFALALVLTATLRHPREWRALLGAHLAVGAAVACLTIADAGGLEIPLFTRSAEFRASRFGGSVGIPTVLSIYMLANLVLAAGFAIRAWLASAGAESSTLRRARTAGWTVVAALHLAAFVLAGSAGGFAGLCAAIGFASFGFAVVARGRRRLAALVLPVVLAVGFAVLGARFFEPERGSIAAIDTLRQLPGGRGLAWMLSTHFRSPSMQGRLSVWRAGLEGFAERPVLGWGPENFLAAYGRHATGYAAAAEAHDYAHNKPIEVAATTGAAGLAFWVALWGLALTVPLLAARATAPPEKILAVFASAALAGHVTQLMLLFDSPASLLISTLLLAFAARLEAAAIPERWRLRLPAGAALLWPKGRFVLGGGAVVAALAGLATNQAILISADVRYLDERAVLSGATAAAVDAFPPLANNWRHRLFEVLERHWPDIRTANPHAAATLLAWADREATEVERTEPANWRTARTLARLYKAVAATEPRYTDAARKHLERSLTLAPNRAVFPVLIVTPRGLGAERLDDGRLLLRWQPSPGAGFHVISRGRGGDPMRPIHWSYDPNSSTYVASPCDGCRHVIKACRWPGACTDSAEWPIAGAPTP